MIVLLDCADWSCGLSREWQMALLCQGLLKPFVWEGSCCHLSLSKHWLSQEQEVCIEII